MPVQRIRHIAFPLLIFFLILAVVNLVQYYRVKSDVASHIIAGINNNELERIQNFFHGVESNLGLVRQWGENGLLELEDTKGLNKKFFPFLGKHSYLHGILLASSQGSEYYLFRRKDQRFTRRSIVSGQHTSMQTQHWLDPDRKSGEASTVQTDYDPRQRPWFITTGNPQNVHWTSKYLFYESRQEGITGSVFWQDNKKNETLVFAMDITLSELEDILAEQETKIPGYLFLTNASNTFHLTTKKAREEKADLLVKEALAQWSEKDDQMSQLIPFNSRGKNWLVSLQPLSTANGHIWVGILAPEQELMGNLQKTLFRLDLVDLGLAVLGGFIMLFFLRKASFFKASHPEEGTVDPAVLVAGLIGKGEGGQVEFKSSVRMNLKAGKQGKEIELAWLKSLCAFLNSDGGDLLIGVADDGALLGLQADGFENNDRCLLHIKNLINQHIGAEFSRLLRIQLVTLQDHQILHIHCLPSTDPVFLKIGKNEEFYIRSGPSSTKLSPSQLLNYTQNRKVSST
jgi:hypothetical protein